MPNFRKADRETMVACDIESRGVNDQHVLNAMREVPREKFMPHDNMKVTYADSPAPIGEGQTISQP